MNQQYGWEKNPLNQYKHYILKSVTLRHIQCTRYYMYNTHTLIKIPLFIFYQQIFCQKDCQYNRSNKFDVDQSTTPNKIICLTYRSTYRSLLIII